MNSFTHLKLLVLHDRGSYRVVFRARSSNRLGVAVVIDEHDKEGGACLYEEGSNTLRAHKRTHRRLDPPEGQMGGWGAGGGARRSNNCPQAISGTPGSRRPKAPSEKTVILVLNNTYENFQERMGRNPGSHNIAHLISTNHAGMHNRQ
jgi:hypothetical protein